MRCRIEAAPAFDARDGHGATPKRVLLTLGCQGEGCRRIKTRRPSWPTIALAAHWALCLSSAARGGGHPEPEQATGSIVMRVHVKRKLWRRRIWNMDEEIHAVSNKVLQGGSSALHHYVFQWPKKTTRLFRMSCQDPGQPILVSFWRVNTGQITKEFLCHYMSLILCLLLYVFLMAVVNFRR